MGKTYTVYIGTYTGTTSKGIYRANFDSDLGTMDEPVLAAETSDPTFVALHPSGKVLYSISEGGKDHDQVTAFSIEPVSGNLTKLNHQSCGGSGPCHVLVDRAGKFAFVANYGSGGAAMLPIAADGSLAAPTAIVQHHGKGTDPNRQEGPHAHHIVLDPANEYAFVTDLGLDKIYSYQFETREGKLIANNSPFTEVAAGSGPRVIVFDKAGKFAYVISEMAATVSAFAYNNSTGILKHLQTLSTLPSDYEGPKSAAHLAIHPNGKWIYASNRVHSSIALFSRNESSGLLQYEKEVNSGGHTPRHFVIDPTGKWLLAGNQDSDSCCIFSIEPKNGTLSLTSHTHRLAKPVCFIFQAS